MDKLIRTAMAGACLAAMTASVAIGQTAAQTAPNANSPAVSQHAMRGDHGPRGERGAFMRPTERIEARLAYVKTALKITNAQQPQWDAYANLARKNAQEMEQRFQSGRAGEPERSRDQRANTIERLERQQSLHAQAVTRIAQRLEVEKPLYAALSPEQKKVADEVLNQHSRHQHFQGGFRRG
jgi:hypothetical protein